VTRVRAEETFDDGLTEHAVAVLAAVEKIPAGCVMSYGDIAEYVGSGTGRTVGAVLSRHGHDPLPWHRVVQSSGNPAPSQPEEALRRLRAEGTPLRGDKVDMRKARWDGVDAGGEGSDG